MQLAGWYRCAAVHHVRDLSARDHMALAATYTGTRLRQRRHPPPDANACPIAGAVHGYRPRATPLCRSSRTDRQWRSLLRTYPADPGRHLRAAELLTGQCFTSADGAGARAEVLSSLMQEIGMPQTLSAFGYRDAAITQLVEGSMKRSRQLSVEPRRLHHDTAAASL